MLTYAALFWWKRTHLTTVKKNRLVISIGLLAWVCQAL
jgi:hypothetical protein